MLPFDSKILTAKMFKRLYRYFGSIVTSNVCEKVILEKRKLNRQTVWGMITAMITSFFSRYPICAQWQIFFVCVWSFLNLFYCFYWFFKSTNKTLFMGSSFICFHCVFEKKYLSTKALFFRILIVYLPLCMRWFSW